MANWMDRLSRFELGGMLFNAAAALALLAVGTTLSYSTVAEVGRCMEYHEYKRIPAYEQTDRKQAPNASIRTGVAQSAQADDDRGKGGQDPDADRFGCHTPDRTDEVSIGYAGLWIAFYAFVVALLFSAVALLTFYIGFVENRKTR